MGSVHLKRYVDRVQDVPGELRRHLALIRDLDEKVQQLQHEIETKSVKQVVEKKPKHSPAATPSYDVASAVTKLVSLADEKVTIAAQVYDFIDKHIQSLDEDLRALDSEIRADKERLGLGEDESAAEKLEASRPQHKGRGRPAALPAAGLEACPEKKRRGRKRANPEAEEEDASRLLPLQTEEDPLYCYCQKPSFGEMVACDNDECSLEWFHYDCVGLTAAPAGKWYCPDCIKIMQEKKVKEK